MIQLHEQQPVLAAGEPLDSAGAAMIMIHGRGATAESILSLAGELNVPGFAYVAPQAAGNTWYPQSFLAPLSANQPWLDSALQKVADVLAYLNESGMPAERTMLLGFSQGACLASEFIARNPQRYGGLAALSGGVIGPDGTPRHEATDHPLQGTPVFLGCSDVDFHIPVERVHETADLMQRLGGDVTTRIYPNMGHTVNVDEIRAVRSMMRDLLSKISS